LYTRKDSAAERSCGSCVITHTRKEKAERRKKKKGDKRRREKREGRKEKSSGYRGGME